MTLKDTFSTRRSVPGVRRQCPPGPWARAGLLVQISHRMRSRGGLPGGAYSQLRNWDVAGRLVPRLAPLLLAISPCVGLPGCFGFLEPAPSTERHFILSSLPAATPVATPSRTLVVGVSPVKLAAYLFDTSLAVRKSANEIEYLPLALWAERLDSGLQRAVAANLATLLPTDQIRLSDWRSADVSVEVYVAIEQFDVDPSGRGNLVAWWRVLSPGGENTLKSGETRLTREGSPPDPDPSGAVATLSELLVDFSRQLAKAIEASLPKKG